MHTLDQIWALFQEIPIAISILSGPFSGTQFIVNPAHSKRKILGVYEHILNPWLNYILPMVEVLWDVGANDGYFTYGCAYRMQKHQDQGYVVAFEPGMQQQSALILPAKWDMYQRTAFEFLPQFVGEKCDEQMVTLDQAWSDRQFLHSKRCLIKVDVEGAELEVLTGAKYLLQAPHHWVVEVHGDHLLEPVLKHFLDAHRDVEIIPYQPHWLLGAEARTIKTSWVVTKPNIEMIKCY